MSFSLSHFLRSQVEPERRWQGRNALLPVENCYRVLDYTLWFVSPVIVLSIGLTFLRLPHLRSDPFFLAGVLASVATLLAAICRGWPFRRRFLIFAIELFAITMILSLAIAITPNWAMLVALLTLLTTLFYGMRAGFAAIAFVIGCEIVVAWGWTAGWLPVTVEGGTDNYFDYRSPVVWMRVLGLSAGLIAAMVFIVRTFLFELQESNRRLVQAQHLANLGSYTVDIRTGEWSASDGLSRLLGLPQRSKARDWADWISLVHPADRAIVQRGFDRAEAPNGDERVKRRYRIVKPDGEERWVREFGQNSRDPRGALLRRTVIVQDITDQVRSEEAVQADNRRFELFFTASPVPMWVFDAQSLAFLEVNDAAVKLYGYSRAEFLAMTIEQIRPEEDVTALRQFMKEAADGTSRRGLWRHRRKDGGLIWVDIYANEITLSARKTRLVHLNDVTTRVRAEEARRRSEQSYQEIFNATNEAIFIHDAETGQLLDVNDTMLRMYGFASKEELMAAAPAALVGEGAEHTMAGAFARIREVAHSEPQTFEWLARKVSGESFWVEVSMRRAEIGGCLRVLAVVRDISARKRAEEELERTQRWLFASQRMSATGGWALNLKTGVIWGSPEAKRIYGVGDDQLSFARLKEFTRPDSRAMLDEAMRRLLAGEAAYDVEFQIVRPSTGDVVDLHSTAEFDAAEQLVVGLVQDVTAAKRAQAELMNQSALIQALIDSIPDLIFFKATDGTYLACNPAFAAFVGQPREAIIGKKDHDVFPKEMADMFCRFDSLMLENLQIQRNEEWVSYPDGRQRLFDTLKTPFWGPDRKLRGVLGISRDITAEKGADRALRLSEDRYRALVETSFDWVWEVDAQARYTYASPRVKDLLGYTPDEVMGKTPFDFMPEAEAARVAQVFGEIAAKRAPVQALENVNRHRDGRLVVVETNGVPVFAPDGTWCGYRGMDRDITARREAERTLRLHGAALKAAANAIVITDRKGLIEWVNPAFTVMSGWTLEAVRGKNSGALLKSGQQSRAFYRQLWETIIAGKVWRGEIVNRRKDGAFRSEDVTITPLHDENGVITHFIAIKQDITERKLMEAQNRQSQRMEAIGTLAGGVAHDLNNILTPMLMVAGLLKDKLPEEHDRELLAMVQVGAQRGAEITKQLLTFSRGTEGALGLMQPRHVLKEMAMVVQETFPREIELRREIAPDLWSVLADPTQVHQVILNLCVNARDAMPKGGQLTIFATNLMIESGDLLLPPTSRAGPYVMIEVRDSGCGIAPEIKDRIFDPFFTTKPLGKGTGLGLSTAIGIVRSYDGFVAVDSVPEKGATFRVYLPATPGGGTSLKESIGNAPAGSGQMILVVDDERDVREAIRYVLERHGYRVCAAVNGEDGLENFRRHEAEIGLVLTDVMMPVMGGVALVAALRSRHPHLPIVAMTGLDQREPRDELTALGVQSVLMKPCPVGELLRMVHQQLERV